MGFFSNFFSRAGRVVRGQLNAGMDNVEDATFENTLKQTVRDMKTELHKVTRAAAEAMSNHNRLEAEYQRHARMADEWKERAKKAIESGREDLAKKALAKKAEADQQVESMRQGVENARDASSKLKERVSDLKRRIDDAERNASTLIARRNAAKAQKKVSQALAGVGEADNAFATLSQFEESVRKEEATAQAYDDMGSSPNEDLEKEFAELDVSSVDDELAALKREMGKA
jgi:phage shock protein A